MLITCQQDTTHMAVDFNRVGHLGKRSVTPPENGCRRRSEVTSIERDHDEIVVVLSNTL